MAQRKVVESERSPSVTSANWKEHILLQKQMYLLGKNERTVSHRISVEQKVLCKRFQWKLRHSKLQHARINQDKSMERNIRNNNAFTFNTNVGFDEDNDEALRKIWPRGRQEIAGMCSPARNGTKLGSTLFKKWDSISLDSDTDKDSAKPTKQSRPQTSVSIVTPILRPRPVSAHPLRGNQTMETGHVGKRRTKLPAYIGTPGKDNRNATEDDANCYYEDNNDDDLSIDERDNILPTDGARRPRAKSAHPTGFMKLVIESNDRTEVNINPKISRRSIPKSSPTPNIFNTEKKPTLLDLHRERLLAADYESRIRIFANSLEGLQADQSHLSDYYTMRLIQNSLADRKKTNRPPATPISDYVRAVGDVKVRPITFKTLDYNYDKLSSTSIRQSCS